MINSWEECTKLTSITLVPISAGDMEEQELRKSLEETFIHGTLYIRTRSPRRRPHKPTDHEGISIGTSVGISIGTSVGTSAGISVGITVRVSVGVSVNADV